MEVEIDERLVRRKERGEGGRGVKERNNSEEYKKRRQA